MKLLLTGDIHLGRTSTQTGALDTLRHSTVGAWERIVDLAIQEQVRVVCLSGDIVDGQNRYWEAVGPLNDGIRKLGEAGIVTLAVSGNHDHDVFPRLAETLPKDVFRLLGARGVWERHVVDNTVAIDGWSFPAAVVDTDPVLTHAIERPSGVPVLGMVHGDLGVADSRYAPLSVDGLGRANVDAWLLGHIHVPTWHQQHPWILYPGSPQALDPGEKGVHGPWLLRVENGRLGTPEQVQLSSVFYAEPVFDVSSWEQPDQDVRRELMHWVDDLRHQHVVFSETVCLRPVLTGRSGMSREIHHEMEALRQTDGGLAEQGTRIVLDRWTDRMLPTMDVAAWEGSDSIPGALIAMSVEDIPADVLKAFRERISAFSGIRESDLSDTELVGYLREASGVLLSEVMR